MRRRVLLGALAGATVRPVHAQGKPPGVGWLLIQGRGVAAGWLKELRNGLAEHGQVEGHSFIFEERYAGGDAGRLESMAQELVQANVSVIIATSQPAVDAVRRVTRVVPVVGRMTDDPVQIGAAASLPRPGGNVTGIYSLLEETNPKRLELLRQAVPGLSKVGALLTLSRGATRQWLAEAVAASNRLGLTLHVMDVGSDVDLDGAFGAAVQAGVGGVLAFRNPTIVTQLRKVVDLAERHRLPAIFDAREYTEAGALMSYGPSLDAIFRRLAFQVDRILKGTPAGDLPIEQPTKLEFVINARAAKAMGLALSPSLLAAADQVIE